jgi:hypothetical protein
MVVPKRNINKQGIPWASILGIPIEYVRSENTEIS